MLTACSSEPQEHPEFAPDYCSKHLCTTTPGVGVTGKGPAAVDGGSAADRPNPTDDTAFELRIVTNASLLQSMPFSSATVDVWIDDAEGGRFTTTTSSADITVGPLGDAPYWGRVRETGGAVSLLGTLQYLPEQSSPKVLNIVDVDALLDLRDQLSTPIELDPSQGHAILSFTRNGVPALGVWVEVGLASLAAYDLGTSFSDVLDGTGERGMATLLNLPAVPFPGGSTELVVHDGDETTRVEVELAQQSVTLMTIPLGS